MSTKQETSATEVAGLLEKMKNVELLTEEEEKVKQQIAIWLKKIKEANKKKQEEALGKIALRRGIRNIPNRPPLKLRFDDSKDE